MDNNVSGLMLSGRNLVLALMDQVTQDRLHSKSVRWRREYFGLGDLANKWYEHVRRRLLPVTNLDVCDAIAFCLNYEVKPGTIARYAQVAYFYSVEVREKYEILPFSRFAYAMSYGERWEDILEASIYYMDDHGGRIPSEAWLDAKFRATALTPEPPPDSGFDGMPDSAAQDLAAFETIPVDEEIPVPAAPLLTMDALGRALNSLIGYCVSARVSQPKMADLMTAVTRLQDVLKGITAEISLRQHKN